MPVPLARRVHHATRAGDRAAVLRYAPEAARQAQQRGAHREAAAHWRTALARTRKTRATIDRPRCLGSTLTRANARSIDQLDEAIAARMRWTSCIARAGPLERPKT